MDGLEMSHVLAWPGAPSLVSSLPTPRAVRARAVPPHGCPTRAKSAGQRVPKHG